MPNALNGNALLRHLYFDTPPPDTLKAPEQTFGQKVGNYASNALHSVGLSQRMADKAANLVDYSPVGVATTAMQMGADLRRQKWGSAAANALSTATNFVPDAKVAGAAVHAVIAPLWHGSPHAFEKFAMEKVGTGEGAQAYGHGLYFAENPQVAKEYQRQTAGDGFLTTSGHVFDPSTLEHLNVRSTLNRTGSLDDALSKAHELLPAASASTLPLLGRDLATLQKLKAEGGITKNPGHLYEVKLNANPEDFLNWDAPIGQQTDKVKQGLAGLAPHGALAESFDPSRIVYEPEMYPRSAIGRLDGMPLPVGAPYVGLGKNRAPTMLRDQGIPGIRYFDQGSRGAGQGTSNYVVFDPSIIDILAKH